MDLECNGQKRQGLEAFAQDGKRGASIESRIGKKKITEAYRMEGKNKS